MKPPIGVVTSMPATLPIVIAVPINPVAQPRSCEEDADERADARLHVGHEEVDSEEGPDTRRGGGPRCHRYQNDCVSAGITAGGT